MAVQFGQKGFGENEKLCNFPDGKPWEEYPECDPEIVRSDKRNL